MKQIVIKLSVTLSFPNYNKKLLKSKLTVFVTIDFNASFLQIKKTCSMALRHYYMFLIIIPVLQQQAVLPVHPHRP